MTQQRKKKNDMFYNYLYTNNLFIPIPNNKNLI